MDFARKIAFIIYCWTFILLCLLLASLFKMLGFTGFRPGSKKGNKVLFLAMFFPENSGYHHRVALWKDRLEKAGWTAHCPGIFNREDFTRLTSEKDLLSFHFSAWCIRFMQVIRSIGYDKVIVRRMLLPYNHYGELFMDRLLLAIHPNAILDFDDDLTNNTTDPETDHIFGKVLLENRLVFYDSLKLYRRFLCGSSHLAGLVTANHPGISTEDFIILPTCIDTASIEKKVYTVRPHVITLGWVGSDNNQFYLDNIIPDLNRVAASFRIKLLVISGRQFAPNEARFEIENRRWSLETEGADISDIDIGLMPLIDDKRCRAKCGFKLIQYMGRGIVSVASDVGVNGEIAGKGSSAYLVSSGENWSDKLTEVISSWNDFPAISSSACKTIEEKYSIDSNKVQLFNFLKRQ